MKKILISSYDLNYGGIETSLVNLLKMLDLNKYDVTLALEKKQGVYLNEIPEKIRVIEYKVSENSNTVIRKLNNLLKRIKWILYNYRKYDASICYATYSKPCGFLTRTASKNKILFVHSNYYLAYDKDKTKVKYFFDELKIKKYNHIVFVSNESRKDIINIYPNLIDRSITINNIIDYDKMLKLSDEKVNVNKPNKKVFLFVGRLDESSKRLTLLLNIAKKCMEYKVKAIFWIIGSGPDEKKYKKIVKDEKIDNVIFMGAKKNPYPYIKKADYMILTSRYEGFPVVFNEAIIFEKPIITTIDVSDDYISISNRFGYVTTPDNIFDKVKELSKKKEMIKEKVNYNSLNKKRIELIEKILENK